MSDQRSHWLDERRNVDRIYRGLVAVCVVLGVADLVLHRHAYAAWEGFPNFYGFFGFAAFWCIVIAGKHLRRVLWRPEDYYDD
ncbi:MAG TPA: hypothetical protein VLT81_14940 [Chondromyces sp.]|nr:hypothetical protein [Chondromyces sp.]